MTSHDDSLKTCSHCKVAKPRSEFSKDSSKKDKLFAHCKECAKKRSAKWRKNNPDKKREHNRKWRENNPNHAREWKENNPDRTQEHYRNWAQNNPEKKAAKDAKRRAAKKNAKTFPSTEAYVASCYGKPCFYCGQPSDTHEHLIPLAKGGDHSEGNIVPACSPCNLSKNDKLVIEFKAYVYRLLGPAAN